MRNQYLKEYFKHFSFTKPVSLVIITALSVAGYGALVFAAPPTTQYAPGETLNPNCAPGSSNCTTKQAWQQNVGSDYVFNLTDSIGIGTNSPNAALDVIGDVVFSGTSGLGSTMGFWFNTDPGFGVDSIGFSNTTTTGMSSFFLAADNLARVFLSGDDTEGTFSFDTDGTETTLGLNVDGSYSPQFGMDSLDGAVEIYARLLNFAAGEGGEQGVFSFSLPAGVATTSMSATGEDPQIDISTYGDDASRIQITSRGDNSTLQIKNDRADFDSEINLGDTGVSSGISINGPTIGLNTWIEDGDSEGSIHLSSFNAHGISYNNWFPATYDGFSKLEIGAHYTDDPDGGHGGAGPFSSGASYIDFWYDRRPGNTTDHFLELGITERGIGGDLNFNDQAMIQTTTDYNLRVGPKHATISDLGHPPIPTYLFLPSIGSADLLTIDDPVTTKNAATQTDYSAMLYASDTRNLFFWTNSVQVNGTEDWEPVSPFERDPATNEVYLYDDTDTVGIGTDPSNGDRLEVFGDIRVGTTGVNGCLKDFSGGTIAGTCSSDEKLKKNIEPVTGILDKFVAIDLVTYEWNAIAGRKGFNQNVEQMGVLAQNVEENFADLVVTDTDGYKQVNYSRLNLLAIEAIRELNEKIESVKTSTTTIITQVLSFESLIAWLADAANGITDLFAQRVHVQELCVGNTCLNEAQINAILDATQTSSSSPNPVPAPSPAPSPTPVPTPNLDPSEEPPAPSEPEQVPEPEPEPESEPEPSEPPPAI